MATSFNEFVDKANDAKISEDMKDALRVLRQDIGIIMCLHDPKDADDSNDLSGVNLEEVA